MTTFKHHKFAPFLLFSCLFQAMPAKACDPRTTSVCLDQVAYAASYGRYGGVWFTDVQGSTAEFRDFVFVLAFKNVIDLAILFRPNDTATRAEALKMVMRSLDRSAPSWRTGAAKITGVIPLPSDVPGESWFRPYVEDALQYGIISQRANFSPNAPITRQEIAKITFLASKLVTPSLEPVNAPETLFLDDAAIDPNVRPYVYGLRRAGVVRGTRENNFDPLSPVLRGQIAKMVATSFFKLESDLRFPIEPAKDAATEDLIKKVAEVLLDGLNAQVGGALTGTLLAPEYSVSAAIKFGVGHLWQLLHKSSLLEKALLNENKLLSLLASKIATNPTTINAAITNVASDWGRNPTGLMLNTQDTVLFALDVLLDVAGEVLSDELRSSDSPVYAGAVSAFVNLAKGSVHVAWGYKSSGATGALAAEINWAVDNWMTLGVDYVTALSWQDEAAAYDDQTKVFNAARAIRGTYSVLSAQDVTAALTAFDNHSDVNGCLDNDHCSARWVAQIRENLGLELINRLR